MNKLWICFGFLALFGVIGYAEDTRAFAGPDYEYYGYEIENDYANNNAEESDKKVQPDNMELKDNEDDSSEVLYDDEYEEALIDSNNATSTDHHTGVNEENDKEEGIDDYQIEDNRSEVKEDKNDIDEFVVKENDFKYIDEQLEESDDMDIESDEKIESDEEIKYSDLLDEASELLEDIHDDDKKIIQDEDHEDIANNVSQGEEEDKIKNSDDFEDENLYNLSQSEESSFKEVIDDIDRFNETEAYNEFFEDDSINTNDTQKLNIDQFQEETKQLLEETKDSFEDNDDGKSILSSMTTSKLDAEINDEDSLDENLESKSSTEKYTIDEETVAQAYNDLKDDLNHLHETLTKLTDDVVNAGINKDNLSSLDEYLNLDKKLADMEQEVQDEDDYEVIDDKDLLKLFSDLPSEDDNDEMLWEDIQDKESDEYEKTNLKSDQLNSDNASEEKIDHSKLIQYVDDALDANKENAIESSTATVSISSRKEETIREHQVEPLEDTPYDDLNIANINGEQKMSVDPLRITLSLDTPVVLTSPNYPRPYPTNAVIDWILEGEGRGIEFNVTDFALNSMAGDYVMIKPGRVDASGNDGILFSHSLNRPRNFRFLDVNRMFIRFDSRLGLNRFRGFSFSVKLIDPLPEDRVSDPDAQPIGYPQDTITLNLGGVTLEGFLRVEEDFRQIVADMATMYIEANQIYPGRNTTLEVTQITSRALCFHNWPQFEHCAEVRFGVPLQYEDENQEPRLNEDDLKDMWVTYSNRDPFALRLERLGIKDFQIPNDGNVLMMWLVIAAGVVISMAMLAFALWRFSCFEDYTRMPSFSDTESVNEKKNLDLYPTPHQTLPPLYSDTEYKWGEEKYDDTARVDMSGFSNRSYVRTEDYDYDSEEEVAVHARDRYTTDV